MDTITIDWLACQYACDDHIKLFEATFGAATAVTRAAARRAAEAGLDLDWLADHLLVGPALAAYEEAIVVAEADYDAATAGARASCEAARIEITRAYLAAIDAARAARAEAAHYRQTQPEAVAADEALVAARVAAGAHYEAAREAAYGDYERATAPARRALKLAQADALADALGLP